MQMSYLSLRKKINIENYRLIDIFPTFSKYMKDQIYERPCMTKCILTLIQFFQTVNVGLVRNIAHKLFTAFDRKMESWCRWGPNKWSNTHWQIGRKELISIILIALFFHYWHLWKVLLNSSFGVASYADNNALHINGLMEYLVKTELNISTNLFKWFRESHMKSNPDISWYMSPDISRYIPIYVTQYIPIYVTRYMSPDISRYMSPPSYIKSSPPNPVQVNMGGHIIYNSAEEKLLRYILIHSFCLNAMYMHLKKRKC